MVPDNVQNRANTVFTVIDTKQDQYFEKHGKYFQSLRSGKGSYTDQIPPDEQNPDDRVLVINGNNPFDMWITEFVGPDGAGYYVTFSYIDGQDEYRCQFYKGGNSGWFLFVNELENGTQG